MIPARGVVIAGTAMAPVRSALPVHHEFEMQVLLIEEEVAEGMGFEPTIRD
jgi:hypothetical protein